MRSFQQKVTIATGAILVCLFFFVVFIKPAIAYTVDEKQTMDESTVSFGSNSGKYRAIAQTFEPDDNQIVGVELKMKRLIACTDQFITIDLCKGTPTSTWNNCPDMVQTSSYDCTYLNQVSSTAFSTVVFEFATSTLDDTETYYFNIYATSTSINSYQLKFHWSTTSTEYAWGDLYTYDDGPNLWTTTDEGVASDLYFKTVTSWLGGEGGETTDPTIDFTDPTDQEVVQAEWGESGVGFGIEYFLEDAWPYGFTACVQYSSDLINVCSGGDTETCPNPSEYFIDCGESAYSYPWELVPIAQGYVQMVIPKTVALPVGTYELMATLHKLGANGTLFTEVARSATTTIGIGTTITNYPTATSTSADWNFSCDPDSGVFVYSMCYLFQYLFMPSDSALSRFGNLRDDLADKPPFGYYTEIKDAISDNLNASSTPAFTISGISILDDALLDTLKTAIRIMLWIAFAVWLFRRIKKFHF